MNSLEDKTNKELVELHNQLASKSNGEVKTLSSWKGKKSVLVDRVEGLRRRFGEKPKASTTDKTIREASLDLLCHADYYEDKTKASTSDNVVDASHPNARSVGLPYLEIIERLKEMFPDAQTSVACLRWYAVKVRAEEFGYEGYKLAQRRPRAKPKK